MSVAEFEYYYFEKNLQGDIVTIYDIYGSVVVKYTYDAWGNVSSNVINANSPAIYNGFKYRGYYYDSETGLYYLNSRYYDPAVGRFINADSYISTGQGLAGYNMYAYCRNEPVFRKDSLGTEDVCATNTENDDNPLNDYGKAPSGGSSGRTPGKASSKVTSESKVHGNSKQSTNMQHQYIIRSSKGIEKVGVSGQPLNKDGTSPRANVQVNYQNKLAGYNKYWAEVIITNVPGRGQILIWEEGLSKYCKFIGEPMGLHKRP